MANLKEAIEYLIAGGYMLCVKGKYKVTNKFYREMEGKDVGALVASSRTLVVQMDWTNQYKQFIADARVPKRCDGRNGEAYDTNKYSENGMKAFRKAMEQGCQYEMLVAATALYYKSGVKMKVAIGRYMEEGRWRSDYDALAESAANNTVKQHIQETTDDGTFIASKLG